MNDKPKFYLEKPSIQRKAEVLELIEEYKKFQSSLIGMGSLKKYMDDYEGWLKQIKKENRQIVTPTKVPTKNYFLIRENDNKIIGLINIRIKLNKKLEKYGGHIGYSIRPTERGKGYNKINLYLGLQECQKYKIKKVFMDADKNNIASWKTMEALGGVNVREFYDDIVFHCTLKDYLIDVDKSLKENKNKYEKYIKVKK